MATSETVYVVLLLKEYFRPNAGSPLLSGVVGLRREVAEAKALAEAALTFEPIDPIEWHSYPIYEGREAHYANVLTSNAWGVARAEALLIVEEALPAEEWYAVAQDVV